jgi:hypothetical protein
VHPDPEFNVTVRWHLLVSFCRSLLHLDTTLDRINGAAEFCRHANTPHWVGLLAMHLELPRTRPSTTDKRDEFRAAASAPLERTTRL